MIAVPFALSSAIAFTYYGFRCLRSSEARQEYRRYGISRFRVMNGVLQLLGATGVMVGLVFSPLGAAAALGLAAMMALGLITRVRLGDAPRLMIPAASLCVLNSVLFGLFLFVV